MSSVASCTWQHRFNSCLIWLQLCEQTDSVTGKLCIRTDIIMDKLYITDQSILPRILSISSHFLISLTCFRWNELTLGLSWNGCKRKYSVKASMIHPYSSLWQCETVQCKTLISAEQPIINHRVSSCTGLFTAAVNSYDL